MPRGLQTFEWTEFTGHKGQPESPQISFRDGMMVIRRIWDINRFDETQEPPFELGDATKIENELIGYPSIEPDLTLRRYLPQQDPEYPDLVATSIISKTGMTWADDDNDTRPEVGHWNVYPRWRVVIEFTRPTYFVRPQDEISTSPNNPQPGDEFKRYTTVTANMEGDYLHVQALQGLFKWASPQTGIGTDAGVAFPETVGKVETASLINVTWHEVPYKRLPLNAIRRCIGCINQEDFGDPDDRTRFWPANTLLMLGAKWDLKQAVDGQLVWDIHYTFKERPTKWNYYYNPRIDGVTPGYYQVTTSGVFFAPGDLPDNLATYNEQKFKHLFNTVDPETP